jgi:hypothetical protein
MHRGDPTYFTLQQLWKTAAIPVLTERVAPLIAAGCHKALPVGALHSQMVSLRRITRHLNRAPAE